MSPVTCHLCIALFGAQQTATKNEDSLAGLGQE
jgi:hypothetical protein